MSPGCSTRPRRAVSDEPRPSRFPGKVAPTRIIPISVPPPCPQAAKFSLSSEDSAPISPTETFCATLLASRERYFGPSRTQPLLWQRLGKWFRAALPVVTAQRPPRRESTRRATLELLEQRELLAAGSFPRGALETSAIPHLAARSVELQRLSAPASLAGQHTVGNAIVAPSRGARHRFGTTGLIQTLTNLVYLNSGGRQETLDVYRPAGPAPAGGWPVVIAIHGGGWFKFSKDDFGRVVAPLAKHGYVVVSINYQLAFPGAPSWPQNFEDVRASVRWVRQNAAALGIDPTRIA